MPNFIEGYIKEGHLPAFRKLMEGGVVANNCLVPLPTITPPNWASIATGAWPGTHQVTDFNVHVPGSPLDDSSPDGKKVIGMIAVEYGPPQLVQRKIALAMIELA